MQATGASLMRRLSSVIHPQLPLDARQTSQLLASLTASFQRHLDKAHPVSFPTTGGSVRETAAPLSSFIENKSHFEKIINHPSFAGSQHSPSPNANLSEKTAFAALRLIEEKLKQGLLDVVQATKSFSIIYRNRLDCQPRTDFSFASRFMTLLQANGPALVKQFFLVTGMRRRWVNLMFHEQREEEILSFACKMEATFLLPYYLSATLQYRPIRQFIAALDQVEKLVNTQFSVHRGSILTSCMLYVTKTLLLEKLDIVGRQDQYTKLEAQLSNSTFAVRAPGSTLLFLALANMLHSSNPSVDKFLLFVENWTQVPEYWLSNRVRRKLLLETSLKAAEILCVQDKTQDAQKVLAFAEILLAQELSAPTTLNVPPRIREKAHKVHVQPVQEEDNNVLSRLVGLLPS